MSLPKIFASGERLFAADLNENFEHVEEAGNLLVPSTGDTGGPWNIPYIDGGVEGSLADFSEDLADAVADGLSAAGGLVAVKHVLKTDTFVTGSLASGSSVAVTDLEITHAVADADNKLIITAYFGMAASSDGRGNCGITVFEDSTPIGVGDADGSRARVSAFGFIVPAANAIISHLNPSVSFVHTPGTGNKTYTVHAVSMLNAGGGNATLFVNRTQQDSNSATNPRAASGLIIQEVKV